MIQFHYKILIWIGVLMFSFVYYVWNIDKMKVKFQQKEGLPQNVETPKSKKPKPENSHRKRPSLQNIINIEANRKKTILQNRNMIENEQSRGFRRKNIQNVGNTKSKKSVEVLGSSSKISMKSIDLEKFDQLLQYQKSAFKEYIELLELYETNQWKLIEIIKKELKDKKYIYAVQILDFLNNPCAGTLKKTNHNLFKMELQKLTDFLTEFNAKKKLKKIEIIRQSMEKREEMIRKSANFQQYYDIFQFMRSPFKINKGITVYDQLRFISEADYSVIPKQNIDVLENVCTKIRVTQQELYFKIKKEAVERKSKNAKMMGIVSNGNS